MIKINQLWTFNSWKFKKKFILLRKAMKCFSQFETRVWDIRVYHSHRFIWDKYFGFLCKIEEWSWEDDRRILVSTLKKIISYQRWNFGFLQCFSFWPIQFRIPTLVWNVRVNVFCIRINISIFIVPNFCWIIWF